MKTIWKKEYDTGFEKIDQQHRKIIEIIDKLDSNILSKVDDDIINDIVMDLKIYTISHLDFEERLFKKYKYSDDNLEEHLDKHNDFRNKISEFMVSEIYVKTELAYKISEYLKKWLFDHISETDKKFVAFLKENGHL